MNTVSLHPDNHAYAVRHFLEYFSIKQAMADADLLIKILESFSQIPYENISKIVKLNRNFLTEDRLRLPEEVMEDFSRHHLGGTCFSLSFFLHTVLYHLGYQTHMVMADMRNRANVHCALVALLNNKVYLIDPGYLLTQPMQIHPDKSRLYRAPHNGVELKFDPESRRYQLYTFDRQLIKFRYSFFVEPTPLPEFLQHWLASFYQAGMHGICMTQMQEDQLVYLHNDFLQVASVNGKNKRHIKQNYEKVVGEVFGIGPEWVEMAQEALAGNMELERIHGLYRLKKGGGHETE
jgi:arylamine N-acetyltransferase